MFRQVVLQVPSPFDASVPIRQGETTQALSASGAELPVGTPENGMIYILRTIDS